MRSSHVVVISADAPEKGRSPETTPINWTIWNRSEDRDCGIT